MPNVLVLHHRWTVITVSDSGERETLDRRWRIGSHYGIHVYNGEIPVATFRNAADALRAVEAVNASGTAVGRVLAEVELRLWAADLPGFRTDAVRIVTAYSKELSAERRAAETDRTDRSS